MVFQYLAHPLDYVEGAGHLVFVFQGSQAALGWMAFGWFLDHYRMGVIWKDLNGNYRVALIKDISIHGSLLSNQLLVLDHFVGTFSNKVLKARLAIG
jgi:hypothetical protein